MGQGCRGEALMPTYSMAAPNGQTYQIDGPDGASDDQVRAEILRQHPDAGQAANNNAAPRSFADYAGMAGRALMKGAEDLKDTFQPTIDQLAGLGGARTLGQMVAGGVTGHNAGSAPTADQEATALKLAQPQTAAEKIGSRAIEYGAQGVLGGLPSAIERAGATGLRAASQVAARELAAGAGAGVTAETANQLGAPQPVQTAAALAAGHAVGMRFGPKVADVVAQTPRDVVLNPEGKLTEDGREIAAQNGIHPDQVKAAYDHFDEVQAKTANDNPNLPPAEAPAMAVGDGLNRSTAEEPPVNTAPQEAVPGAAAGAAPPPEPPPAAAQRLGEAQSEGVDLTKGQATQDFATQEAEDTLLNTHGTPESAEARKFKLKQQQQISDALDRFRNAFGNREATAEDRGAQVQEALRTLRDNGKAGVSALYTQARDMAASLGEAGSNLVRLDTDALVSAMRKLWSDPLIDRGVRQALKEEAARYQLIGHEPSTVEGETTVKLRDSTGQPAGRVSFTGQPEPLTITNAETLRQRINQMWDVDKTKQTQALKPLIDDAVQKAVERAATEAPGGVGDAFKAARGAHQQQMATYKAGDIVQSLIDWKKGAPGTPQVQPDQVLKKILGNDPDSITSLKKVKAILLSNRSDKSAAAWNAIQAHAIGKIFDKAFVTNANPGGGVLGEVSGAKLNTAIQAFGVDKLKILLPEAEFNQLMKLRRVVGNATIPIKGTINPAGSGYKIINFLAKQGEKLGAVAHFVPFVGPLAKGAIQVGAHAVKSAQESAKAAKTLKGIREYDLTQAANEDAKGAKPDAGKFVSDFIRTARDPNIVAPILAASSTQSTEEPTR
jgi:hypothetical protein